MLYLFSSRGLPIYTMNQLLKKSQELKINKQQTRFSKDEIELALAYVKGVINFSQLKHALKTEENSSTQIYSFISRALRQHYTK